MKNQIRKCTYGTLSLLCFAAPPSNASDIHWQGFLSLVGGKTLNSGAEYDTGFFGYDGVYNHSSITFAPETVAAIQGQKKINDKLKLTVQFLGRGTDELDAGLEWAYVSYQLSNELTLHAGKYRIPLYYYSNFLDVAYAYHWIRPPAELYSGPSALKGINLNYKRSVGDYTISSYFWYGDADYTFQGVEVPSPNNTGLTFQVERDWWTARVVYNQTELLFTLPGNIELDSDLTFKGISFVSEKGALKVVSEFTELEIVNSLSADKWSSYYASAGYTIGKFTPHITYAHTGEITSQFTPGTEELTAGLRWDFDPSAAFKVEFINKSYDEFNGATLDDVEFISFGIDVLF